MKPLEISFKPVDNKRLANLCGALDENLRQIETALDVVITRRGENFSLRGEPEQTRLAAQALRSFYSRADDDLSIDDLQLGLIEIAGGHATAGVENTVSPLKTRRQDLHGRTPRQVEYLKQIQKHDITFAIGPAGTGKTYLAVASAVDALCAQLVQLPTHAMVRTRQAMLAAQAHSLGEHLAYEALLMHELGRSADYVEGVTAFLEKRAPRFHGG